MDGTKAIPCQRRENKSDSSLPNFSFTTIVGPISSSYQVPKGLITKSTTYTPTVFLNLYYYCLCKRNFDDAIKVLSLCQVCKKYIYNIYIFKVINHSISFN